MSEAILNLVPPLVESAADVEGFVESGRTLCASLSPARNTLAAFVKPTEACLASGKTTIFNEEPIYLAGLSRPPSSERRLFVTDTSIIFTALQNLRRSSQAQGPDWLQGDRIRDAVRKLSIDYINFARECWVHASRNTSSSDDQLQLPSDHYKALYSTFSLFVVLFLPESGFEDMPIGDEIMEWLNVHFIEPSTEEGDQLTSNSQPWTDSSFWPYMTKATLRGLSHACVFFLQELSRHPSEDLQQISQQLIPLLESQPRLQNFSSEREFVTISNQWKDKIKALRARLDRVPSSRRKEGSDRWWNSVSDLVGILEGRGEVVQRVCEDLGADWKEMFAAWTIFVDPHLRRQDLPDLAARILEDMPADDSSLEDMIHASLASGRSLEALSHSDKFDVWLAAHLADVMNCIELIESEPDAESGLSIRDEYVLHYAEYLQSDPGCWRLSVAYMCSCGELGKARADEILLRVPLKLHEKPEISRGDDTSAEDIRAGDVTGVLKEVNETCFDYQREGVRRTICRVAAQTFVQERNYGLAVSYCTSAEDWPGLGRVIDHILNEYIVNGPETFTRLVANIAPSLQRIRTHAGPHGIFVHRLMFAVRYAEFHHRRMNNDLQEAALDLISMFTDGLAPQSWWGTLLWDSIEFLQYQPQLLFSAVGAAELLRRVDEVFLRAEHGAGDDYLSILMLTMHFNGPQEALHRLKAVRLALARYFARCSMVSGGHRPDYPPLQPAPRQVV